MVSGLEVGGLAGSLLAGRLADGMVNRSKDPIKEGAVGKRVQVRRRAVCLRDQEHACMHAQCLLDHDLAS